jgi:tRNA 2-selenouridine synthase
MIQKLTVEKFLAESCGHPVIDVRAPVEFNHAHMPGAISLPLFSDEERAHIGTLYKKEGREKAMLLGLGYYGKNMQRIISGLRNQTDDREIFIHCWRGGMRSGVVGWMLDLFGYNVSTLAGGYKSFRRAVLDSFFSEKNIMILGGKTGAAKTETLQSLEKRGEQIIDLEKIARHRGSAFGDLGMGKQPTQEQFENELYFAFKKLNTEKIVWMEDESQRIGLVNLPNALWSQMRNAAVIYLEIPFEERLNYLVKVYGKYPLTEMTRATQRIQKRLGGLNTRNVIDFFQKMQQKEAFEILLHYYDNQYEKATTQRDQWKIKFLRCPEVNPELIAEKLLEFSAKIFSESPAERASLEHG